MPVSVAEHFKLDPALFRSSGAFDALVDWDSLFFVDPHLLEGCSVPEFFGAHHELLRFFRDTIRLAAASRNEGDRAWREAKKRLRFGEIGAFGLGYATGHSQGSGIGYGFADQLVKSLREIHALGIEDPELFELLGLFEDGVGADRISDMTCRILVTRFARFTERVFDECGFRVRHEWRIGGKTYLLPNHPSHKGLPVLLAPREILRSLPTADTFNLAEVYSHNDQLRSSLNSILGEDWRKELSGKKKPDLKKFLVANPDFLQELINAYKFTPISRYDFDADPAGEIFWREKAREFVQRFPLHLEVSRPPQAADLIQVTRSICDAFRRHIERTAYGKSLSTTTKGPARSGLRKDFSFRSPRVIAEQTISILVPRATRDRAQSISNFHAASKEKS